MIMEKIRAQLLRYSLIWLVVIPAIFAVIFINPLREMALEDDWAYSLTVRHLLETGNYQLNNWLAANMPFQAYWGLLFSRVIGFSHSTLHISTLVLAFFGLIAFYYLAREHGLGPVQSSVLTLSLLAGPLFLKFSFTFNTDIPFLACLITALLCYSRALRLLSTRWMIAGSLAASCAILTRQLGVALPIGLFVLWLFEPERRSRVGFFIAGIALPVVAAAWQVYAGSATPNWAAQYVKIEQQAYILNSLASPVPSIFANIWRLTAILHYLALFALPLLLLAITGFRPHLRQNQERSTTGKVARVARRAEIILVIWIGGSALLTGFYGRFMPYFPWNFDVTPVHGLDIFVTILTTIGAIELTHIVFQAAIQEGFRANKTESKFLLEIVTIFLLVFLMFFFQIGDQYLIVLMPFTLIVIGRKLQLRLTRWSTIALLGAFMSVGVLWTRGQFSRVEAIWKASDTLAATGVESTNIYGDWIWNAYHGIFDEYIANADDQQRYSLKNFFYNWLPQKQAAAQYWVVTTLNPPNDENWEVVATIPFQGDFFQGQKAYVVKRSSR